MTEDTRTLDELYAEDSRMDAEVAKIRRQQGELWKVIARREREVDLRRQVAAQQKEG